MTNDGRGLTKNQKREHARELARLNREAERKRQRRRRWITQASVIVGALAVVALVAVVLTSGGKSAPGPLNMLSDGIVVTGDGTTTTALSTDALAADAEPVATQWSDTSDTANIVVYLDYLCPYCGAFETANTEQISSLVASGAATLEVHPISILDRLSNGTEYSTRAANAASCVADSDPDSFLAINAALFANQPAENTDGLTDAELIELVASVGVDGTDVATCITDGTFTDWVGEATDRALDGPLPNTDVEAVEGTPTVLVNGTLYEGAVDDPQAFADFVTATVATS
jgi:protein-disulfide isomerase